MKKRNWFENNFDLVLPKATADSAGVCFAIFLFIVKGEWTEKTLVRNLIWMPRRFFKSSSWHMWHAREQKRTSLNETNWLRKNRNEDRSRLNKKLAKVSLGSYDVEKWKFVYKNRRRQSFQILKNLGCSWKHENQSLSRLHSTKTVA